MNRLRTVIVDDEPPARTLVRSLLSREPDIDVVGEYGDGASAVDGLSEDPPDLVFLDIQMPELDGLAVARALVGLLPPAKLPVIIFVTAYDQYAVHAFDLHAVDYVLKPLEDERFARAVERARDRQKRQVDPPDRLLALLDTLERERRYRDRLIARDGERAYFLPIEEIEWIEAARKHVFAHAGGKRHAIHEAIGRLELQLDPRLFARISRSVIVNLRRVREIQPWFQGEYLLVMSDGTRQTTTRSFRDAIRSLFS